MELLFDLIWAFIDWVIELALDEELKPQKVVM